MKQYLIAPSILSADFARLGEDTAKALAAGADVVHFDVMDNHYVPNLTIGPMVLKSLRNYGITAPIDVHLMVKPVDRIIPDFAEAGASVRYAVQPQRQLLEAGEQYRLLLHFQRDEELRLDLCFLLQQLL